MAGEAGVIVQEQPARFPSTGNRAVKHGEKTVFGFAEAGFQIRDDPASIIEKAEDDGLLGTPRGRIDESGSVQGIRLPQFAAHRGLPAKARGDIQFHPRAGEAFATQQPLDGVDAHLAEIDAACQFQFAQDQGRRTGSVRGSSGAEWQG